MLIFKIILLISIIIASTLIGILFSKKYSKREKELNVDVVEVMMCPLGC